jgi:outer membrane protease
MDGSKRQMAMGQMDDFDWMIENEEWTDWSHHKDTTITKAGFLI